MPFFRVSVLEGQPHIEAHLAFLDVISVQVYCRLKVGVYTKDASGDSLSGLVGFL
jgi:hypothetical protein